MCWLYRYQVHMHDQVSATVQQRWIGRRVVQLHMTVRALLNEMGGNHPDIPDFESD